MSFLKASAVYDSVVRTICLKNVLEKVNSRKKGIYGWKLGLHEEGSVVAGRGSIKNQG